MRRVRTANLLGALADEVSSAMQRSVRSQAGLGGESASALTVLLHSPGLSVKQLARFLGISSPATVELLGRLEGDGLVTVTSGADRRSRVLRLSASGRRRAQKVLAARRLITEDLLKGMTVSDREGLERASALLLGSLAAGGADPDNLCRRCDESVCPAATCPVEVGSG